MAFIEKISGISIWKLTNPPKLLLGICVLTSGSVLAAQQILACSIF